MSLKALFLSSEYLPPAKNIDQPLAFRLPNHDIGYISTGHGGIVTAVIRTTKFGPTVSKVETYPEFSSHALGEALGNLKKKVRTFLGPKPLIIGYSNNLYWDIKNSVSFSNQDDFVKTLRSDPQRVVGGIDETLCYTGVLQPGTGAGMIFGITKTDIASVRDVATQKGFEVVRETIPAMAMFELLLADPRVQSRELTPIVVDQGQIIATIVNDTGWDSMVGRRFVGIPDAESAIREVIYELQSRGVTKLLVAISNSNGGLNIETVLRQGTASVDIFSVGTLPSSDLFPYATALF